MSAGAIVLVSAMWLLGSIWYVLLGNRLWPIIAVVEVMLLCILLAVLST